MKIVLPVHHFPPNYSAGAELYTFRLARWLLNHGHKAEVVCIESMHWGRNNHVTAVCDTYQGISVWRLAVEVAQKDWPVRSFDNPDLTAWFVNYLNEAQPDLVHFQAGYLIGAGPLRASVAARIPTVLTLHDFWFLCPRISLLRGDGKLCNSPPADTQECAWCMHLDGRGARFANQLGSSVTSWIGETILSGEGRQLATRREVLQEAMHMPHTVIAPSRFLAECFRAYIPPDRLQVLPYGLDTSQLRLTPPPSNDGILRLAYLGQIAAQKGVHVLIEAMRLLPSTGCPIELTIWGDVEQHKSYGRKIRAMAAADPRIRLAGRFENSRITEVLGACDATVVPSVWYENSPLAIWEAHAAGRPVLTSDLGGMSELVQDEVNGLLFKPGSAADLARQIQRLRDEPYLLERLHQGVTPPTGLDEAMAALMQLYVSTVEEHIARAV